MSETVYSGVWEEVGKRYAGVLAGKRVEVHVLESDSQLSVRKIEDAQAAVREMMKDKPGLKHPILVEDIYDEPAE